MSVNLRQIVLASPRPTIVAQLLSDVLDWPMTPVGEGVRLGLEGQGSLLFIKAQIKAPRGQGIDSTLVDFWVETDQELDELHQRWQFARYRHGLDAEGHVPLTTTDTARYFIIHDPDGRKWKFSFVN
jgi:hypothetical protein